MHVLSLVGLLFLTFVYPCLFFTDTATTEIYTPSLHYALPIFPGSSWVCLGLPGSGSSINNTKPHQEEWQDVSVPSVYSNRGIFLPFTSLTHTHTPDTAAGTQQTPCDLDHGKRERAVHPSAHTTPPPPHGCVHTHSTSDAGFERSAAGVVWFGGEEGGETRERDSGGAVSDRQDSPGG